MHHGSEGERGDEASQKVLNAHTQDGHTWGTEHTENRKLLIAPIVFLK